MAAGQPVPEEDAGLQKRSRTGRVIVPPGRPEEAVTPTKAEDAAAYKMRGTAHTDAMPQQTPEPEQARQEGRRRAKKRARKAEWPPAAAGQLAAAQKVRADPGPYSEAGVSIAPLITAVLAWRLLSRHTNTKKLLVLPTRTAS